MKWGSKVKFQKEKDRALVVNLKRGTRIFISNECLEYINYMIDNNFDINTFLNIFESKEDIKYMDELVGVLRELEILVDNEDSSIPIEEIRLSWDITNECNLRCTHCCVSAGDKERGKELTTKELLFIADRIIELSPESLSISGGEPLIRKDFMKIIKYLKNGYKGKLQLMTNGVLINNSLADFIIENFYSIDISLDGVDEDTCRIIRGVGVFDKVIKNIKLLKLKGMDNISVSMLKFDKTKDLKGEFGELCNKLGVRPIIRLFDPIGRGKENSEKLRIVNSNRSIELKNEKKIDSKSLILPITFSCGGAYREFQIDQKGEMFPCASLMEEKYSLGNIFNILDLKDYISLGKFKKTEGYKIFNGYKPYNMEECSECNKNLICFRCVREIIKLKESNKFNEFCELSKRY